MEEEVWLIVVDEPPVMRGLGDEAFDQTGELRFCVRRLIRNRHAFTERQVLP
jgi:hypothetical protein